MKKMWKAGFLTRGAHRRERKKWMLTVLAGFLVLYLVIMAACTYMVEAKYMSEFARDFETYASGVKDSLEEMNRNGGTKEEKKSACQAIAAASLLFHKYQQFSLAIYDEEEQIAVQTEKALAVYRDDEQQYFSSVSVLLLTDLLTDEELSQLAAFKADERYGEGQEKYRFFGKISDEQELLALLVQQCFWTEDNDEKLQPERDPITGEASRISHTDGEGHTVSYAKTGSAVVWEWENSRGNGQEEDWISLGLAFPGISLGYGAWERWCESDFLRDPLPEDPAEYYKSTDQTYMAPVDLKPRIRMDYQVRLDGDREAPCYFSLLMESRPWAAAADYMKYVYISGAVLTLLCVGTVYFAILRGERQRMLQEESRRDFINALAHEMKTPLSVIRGFSENLLEDTVTEKRDYYLEQIVRQTEEMDELIVRMIGMAGLDSRKLALKKEEVNVNHMLQDLLKKYESQIRNRGIETEFSVREAFVLQGDRSWLERALGSLVDNAVNYCAPGGRIRVETFGRGFRMENSCPLEAAVDQERLFELFYTGGERTEASVKHLGAGLYLAKKILDLHHVRITAGQKGDMFFVECTADF